MPSASNIIATLLLAAAAQHPQPADAFVSPSGVLRVTNAQRLDAAARVSSVVAGAAGCWSASALGARSSFAPALPRVGGTSGVVQGARGGHLSMKVVNVGVIGAGRCVTHPLDLFAQIPYIASTLLVSHRQSRLSLAL